MNSSSDEGALRSMFQEIILKHYRKPRNRGELENANFTVHIDNPICGDEITLHVSRSAEGIGEVRFQGHGCSISQASASMMTDLVQGRSLSSVRDLHNSFASMLRGESVDPALGEARALSGVAKYPARVRCAMLAWSALEEVLSTGNEGRDSRGRSRSS